MLIYRVETVSGIGAYGSGYDVSDCYSENHPGPKGDGVDTTDLYCGHYFGFRSIQHLNAWFNKTTRKSCHDEMEAVVDQYRGDKEHALIIAVYEVPLAYVKMGHKQLIFEKHKAKRIRVKDIYTMKDIYTVH